MPGVRLSSAYRGNLSRGDAATDWIDTFVLADGRLAISIGDATDGDGRRAVHAVRAALRDAAERTSPLGALRHANTVLAKLRSGAMVTAIFGVLDGTTLAFTYGCAGHPPPLAAKADGSVDELPGRGTGIPLGVFADLAAVELATQLEPGDVLALYTD
ncbi:MAG: PP2C family protein-serine/threonine phosphatase, partial [Candidatus Velthaea sp.]